jgi:hypothetical protein
LTPLEKELQRIKKTAFKIADTAAAEQQIKRANKQHITNRNSGASSR